MKHLHLYEGFLTDFHQQQQGIQALRTNLEAQQTKLLQSLTDTYRSIWNLVKTRGTLIPGTGMNQITPTPIKISGILYTYVQIFNNDPTSIYLNTNGSAESTNTDYPFENCLADAETIMRVRDALQLDYPDYFEGQEMGFFIKESKSLKSPATITHLFASGTTKTSFPVRMVYLPTPGKELEVLVSAPIKNFPRAVDRNTIKRMLRTAVQDSKATGYAIALIYLGKELLPAARINSAVGKLLAGLH